MTRAAASILALTLLLVPWGQLPARADGRSGGPLELQLFRPAMDAAGGLAVNSSQPLGHLEPSFGLVLSWARRPLSLASSEVTRAAGLTDESGAPLVSRYRVDNLVTAQLQAALGLWGVGQVGLSLPLTLWNGDTDPSPSSQLNQLDRGGIEAQGAGDLALQLKGRLLDTSRHPLGLALALTVTLPTGDDKAFLGSGRVGFAPRVILERGLWDSRLTLRAELGALLRTGSRSWTDARTCAVAAGEPLPCGTGRRLESTHQLTWGVGAALELVRGRLDLVAELVGQTGLPEVGQAERLDSAAEALAGVKLHLARSSRFALGVGRGLRAQGDNHQLGSPDVRLLGAFIFEPAVGDRDGDGIKDDLDRCPTDPEDMDDFEDADGCPDPDNDKDGILDVDDRCPNEPEDKDGVEDTDGCPEPDVLDRDGDGVADPQDHCPDQPEDKDGFEDADGCPDPDNDRDGILDVDDMCPGEPEDKDGFEDKDGCPDPDNDKDGILDVDDQCPNEPETVNHYLDQDGCPDRTVLRRTGTGLKILKPIHFETASAVIKPVSWPILDAVASYLGTATDILRVEIQGHADERGDDAYNLRLTDDRAHAVLRYLVQKGVAAGRLRARGYGETRPVDPRHTPEAWARNRRVDFVIRKRAE